MRKMDEIGRNALVEIAGVEKIPAKIDTGADSSAIWASDIKIGKDGVLRFKLFGKKSPFFNNKILKRRDYKIVVVRSSNGEERIAYQTYLSTKINDRRIRIKFNLSDRSGNNFPVLIGRRTLQGKFLVNVMKSEVKSFKKNRKTKILNEICKENPYEFYEKYVKNTKKGEEK